MIRDRTQMNKEDLGDETESQKARVGRCSPQENKKKKTKRQRNASRVQHSSRPHFRLLLNFLKFGSRT